MADVVPALLAADLTEYNRQLDRLAFAKRISIDLGDGEFTPTKTINVIEAHWPEGVKADFHLMYQRPAAELSTIISLEPNLVVIHAEAEGELLEIMSRLKQLGINVGVALLQETSVETAQPLIAVANQVLIFSGSLGKYGGEFDSRQLAKIPQIKAINPSAEIAWDGGVNEANVAQIVAAGVDVLNVGGSIAKADNPKLAFEKLQALAGGGV